jgi:hypothetical protein
MASSRKSADLALESRRNPYPAGVNTPPMGAENLFGDACAVSWILRTAAGETLGSHGKRSGPRNASTNDTRWPGDYGWRGVAEEHDYERLFRESTPALWRAAYGFVSGRRQASAI